MITIRTPFHPQSVPGCLVQPVIIGLLLVACGILVVAFRPLRVPSTSVLTAEAAYYSVRLYLLKATGLREYYSHGNHGGEAWPGTNKHLG